MDALDLGCVQDSVAAGGRLCPGLDAVGDVGLSTFGAAFARLEQMDVSEEVDGGNVVEG